MFLTKAQKRREKWKRIAEREEKVWRRWCGIPKHCYPYEQLPFPQPYKDTDAIIQQYRTTPTSESLSTCRAWTPQQLWEIGSLRKAIFNELHGAEDFPGSNHSAEYCLTHILWCWNTNLSWNKVLKDTPSAGPEFLIHFLKLRYETGLNIWCLGREDARGVSLLKEACARARAFQLFLAHFYRTAHGDFKHFDTGSGVERHLMRVYGTACWLQDIVHVGGKAVKLRPRVTENDLLNEWYFEDEIADDRKIGEVRGSESWKRAVVIITPNQFADDFFGYEESTDESSEEDSEESEEEEEMVAGNDSIEKETFDTVDEAELMEWEQESGMEEEWFEEDDPLPDEDIWEAMQDHMQKGGLPEEDDPLQDEDIREAIEESERYRLC